MNENKSKNFYKYIDNNNQKIYYLYLRESRNQFNSFCFTILLKKSNLFYDCYKITFVLDTINQYIKYKKFESINSIFKELGNLISTGKILISIKKEKEINIIFYTEGNNTFSFNLDFMTEYMDADIQNNEELVSKLELDVKDHTNNINKTEKKYEELENKINQLNISMNEILQKIEKEKEERKMNNMNNSYMNNQIMNYGNTYNKRNEEEEIYKLLGIHSSIIRYKEEIELISLWLSRERAIKLEQIFVGSLDFFDSNYFHIKCDNAVPTLTLIETIKGNRFGGFTNQTWKGTFEFKKDNTAFIFSLDRREKYPINNNCINNAILCKTQYLSSFGRGDILLFDKCNKMLNKCDFPSSYGNNNCKPYALTNGEPNFVVKEIEVYVVDFDLIKNKNL